MTGSDHDMPHGKFTDVPCDRMTRDRIQESVCARAAEIIRQFPQAVPAIQALSTDLGWLDRAQLRRLTSDLAVPQAPRWRKLIQFHRDDDLRRKVEFCGNLEMALPEHDFIRSLVLQSLRPSPQGYRTWADWISYPSIILVLTAMLTLYIVPIYVDLYTGFAISSPLLGLLELLGKVFVWVLIFGVFQGSLWAIRQFGPGQRMMQRRNECLLLSGLLNLGISREDALRWVQNDCFRSSSLGTGKKLWQRLRTQTFVARKTKEQRSQDSREPSIWNKPLGEVFGFKSSAKPSFGPRLGRTSSLAASPLCQLQSNAAWFALQQSSNDVELAAVFRNLARAYDQGIRKQGEGRFFDFGQQVALCFVSLLLLTVVLSTSIPMLYLLQNLS
jgi:hypothetical protein